MALEANIPLSLRPMIAADVAAVAAIEQRAYEQGWSYATMAALLGKAHYFADVLLSVDKSGAETLLGYCFYSVLADEAHILNICIAPEYQSLGFGRHLLQAIIAKVKAEQAAQIYLEVRASHQAAIALYQGLGFVYAACRKDYYPSDAGREDAWVFIKTL